MRPQFDRQPETPRVERRSDAAIARFAADQHGVVTLADLERLGLSARAVRHRVASGRLHRLHRGVYVQGRPTEQARWIGAVRAAGAGALLSHRSAAALWGLRPDSRVRIDVTVQGSAGRARAGVDVHSGALIVDRDRTSLDGIPCTSLARTLLDLAAIMERPALARAIDRAEELRAFDMVAVEEVLKRCSGRQGTGALREALAEHVGLTITRSDAEDRFLEILDEAGLARPKVNYWIPLDAGSGYRPDFLWPDERLIVEVDSRTHHSTRRAFAHDRRRDRRLALAGYQTYRYAARDLFESPGAVAAELQRLLTAASRKTAS